MLLIFSAATPTMHNRQHPPHNMQHLAPPPSYPAPSPLQQLPSPPSYNAAHFAMSQQYARQPKAPPPNLVSNDHDFDDLSPPNIAPPFNDNVFRRILNTTSNPRYPHQNYPQRPPPRDYSAENKQQRLLLRQQRFAPPVPDTQDTQQIWQHWTPHSTNTAHGTALLQPRPRSHTPTQRFDPPPQHNDDYRPEPTFNPKRMYARCHNLQLCRQARLGSAFAHLALPLDPGWQTQTHCKPQRIEQSK